MTEITENLWAKDIPTIKTENPKKILLKQAKFLEEMTKGVLIGEVENLTHGQNSELLRTTLSINAPFVSGYRTNILFADYSFLTIYPIKVYSFLDNGYQSEEIYSLEEFKNIVSKILSSEKAKLILGNLISESEVAA